MSATAPDVLMDPNTGDLPDFTRLVRGPEIVAQAIECRLQTHRGDWALKKDEGIDWQFWLSSGDLDGMVTAVFREILDTDGVIALEDTDWTLSSDGRSATITATVITADRSRIPLTITPLGVAGNISIATGAILAPRGKVVYR